MPDDIGSTVPRRQLGRLLRQHRTKAGVTLDAASQALEYSRQKIWRIECGLSAVRALDVKAMCELYGAPAEVTEALMELAGQTKSKGWWQAYGDAVPSWFELYLGLESAASRLRGYDESLMPGLLQTRQYAQAVYRLDRPHARERDRERAVEFKLRRQSLLTRRIPAAPRVAHVLSEAVLRRPVPGPAVMRAQLDHLTALSDLPNVSLRVLPLAAGVQPGAVAGSFVILDFAPPEDGRTTPEPSVVYTESLTGALYLDKADELRAYEAVWQGLDARALDEDESRDMIKRIASELRHD